MAVFSLAGGLIGADIALWPWDVPVSLPVPTMAGVIAGLITGVLIVWVVRRSEEAK
jgi:hypothetical protein